LKLIFNPHHTKSEWYIAPYNVVDNIHMNIPVFTWNFQFIFLITILIVKS